MAPAIDYYREDENVAFQMPTLVPMAEGETVFGTATVGNDHRAETGVLQQFNNIQDLK